MILCPTQTTTWRHPAQTYNEWLKGYDPDRWADDRQTLAADVVVLTILGSALSVVFRRRTEWPEYGSWAYQARSSGRTSRLMTPPAGRLGK